MGAGDDKLEGKKARYLELFRYSAALVAAIAILINATAKFQQEIQMYKTGTFRGVDALPAFALLLMTVLYGVAWYTSATKEFGLFEKFYAEYAPERPVTSILATILVPASLVLLAYYSDDIVTYSVLFFVYVIINIMIRSAVRKEVRIVLKKSSDSVDSKVNSEFRLLYIKRPFQFLNFTLIIASAFGMWAGSGAIGAPNFSFITLPPKLLAYVVVISTLALNEILIWSWRARLYRLTRD